MNLQQPHQAKATPPFSGETYDHERDHLRLSAQYWQVFSLMSDGQPRTLEQISAALGGAPTPSISARLRDMRKPRFGAHTVEREHISNGLYTYRVIVNKESTNGI